ncbi:MAG: transglycosylase SLT domain-containing protein [Methylococcales bacterium]
MLLTPNNPLKLAVLSLALGTYASPSSAFVPSGYQQVAQLHQVPGQYFYAIALNESGKKLTGRAFRPWPWTLNVAGKAYFYPTRNACYQALMAVLKTGKQLVDIGLMQVNWLYHHDKLHDPWQALDPYFNLQVGARIFRAEYDKTHNWFEAVGRYHSPGLKVGQKQRALRYAEQVFGRIEKLKGSL